MSFVSEFHPVSEFYPVSELHLAFPRDLGFPGIVVRIRLVLVLLRVGHLCFDELNMLAHPGIVLAQLELFRLCPFVLGRVVGVSSAGCRHEADVIAHGCSSDRKGGK